MNRTSTLRYTFYGYLACSLALIATSLYTGHRATAISGHPHYMLTATHIFVEEHVAADNAADAAFDAALQEAGESTTIPVKRALFVLGFADVTGPVVIAGGCLLLTTGWWSRRRRRRLADSGSIGPNQV